MRRSAPSPPPASGTHVVTRRRLAPAGSMAMLLLLAPPLLAQNGAPAEQAPPRAAAARNETFETARITASRSVGTTRINMPAGGRFEATNVSVRTLVRFAYQVQDFQIGGGPSWIGSERFDIVAQRPSDLPPQLDGTPRLRARVRALLAERFKLKIERETKDLPIYELTLARGDRAAGPGLRPSTLDCPALAREFARTREKPGTPPPAGLMQCGVRMTPGSLSAGGASVADLVRALSQLTGRSVENKTGLTGNFDIQLDYFHELAPPGDLGLAAADRAETGQPSLFTALQDQLGLRLESKRGPVDMLMIAHVERPEGR